ncbi:hypothetical protein BDF19DRAFT_437228, partial [Syncephalis fuscata]
MPALNNTRSAKQQPNTCIKSKRHRSFRNIKSLDASSQTNQDMTAADEQWLKKTAPSGRLIPSLAEPIVATKSEWFATADGWMMALGPRVPMANGQISATYIMCHTNETKVRAMLQRMQPLKRYAMMEYNQRGIWHAGTEITSLLNYFIMNERYFCLYVTWN